MGKYRDYAHSRTSLSRNKPSNTRGILGDAISSGVSSAKEYVSAAQQKVNDAWAAKINDMSYYTGDSGLVDARSMNPTAEIYKHRTTEIALIDNLSMINALPPIPDNVVDPPVIWEKTQVKTGLTSWGSLIVGRDYLQRVIARGQFLTLVPLDITPNLLGSVGQNVANKLSSGKLIGAANDLGNNFLTKLNNRLNNASYGLVAKVNSIKYYKAVNAHMKAAMLSLGIDIDTENMTGAQLSQLKKYLPNEIVDRLSGPMSGAKVGIQSALGGEDKSSKNAPATDLSNKKITSVDSRYLGIEDINTITKVESDPQQIVRKASYMNLLKYLINVDEGDEVNKTMPFACFYCNGPIEKGMSASSSMGESAIAKMTTDVVSKGVMAAPAAQAAVGIVDSLTGGSSEDYIREMAYHRNTGSFLVSNTYIPNVIKSSMVDFQYTVNIRDVAVSSDRYSIARLFWTLSQLFPFVIQTNEPGQPLIVPSAPMYCSAFSKGVMNLPRAAITSLNIKSSPEFQTTEGIPTELDITLTIQPLFTQSTMPNFDKFYDGANNPLYVAAALFNPLSSFNIIATLCGQNTVLTKFQAGLLAFFIGGSVRTFLDSIKNTGGVIAGSWQDWWTSSSIMGNEVMSRTRILGNM